MKSVVVNALSALIDAHFPDEPLNGLLRAAVKLKQEERSIWGELTDTAYRMFGGASERIAHRTAVAELVLLALDIVDDLQDEDNVNAVWMQSPRALALNAVLALYALAAVELAAGEGRGAEALASFGRMLAESVNGQQRDIDGNIGSEDEYVEMAARKSGSLYRLACMLGYTLVDPPLDPSVVSTMDELALCAGMIAQLENDLNDVLRFDVKSDLLGRKKTIATLFLLRGSAEEFPGLLDYYEGRMSVERFLQLQPDIAAYVSGSGCIEYTRAIQHLYREQAEPLLARLPVSDAWRERFRELLNLNA
ncbi:polyprenyl synthetase family protein [Paenibacillus chartarius]|uniref:Polyprenyl synthetase family protein n=1 Tax=Paenibacillus chartarius TaxID=747481 RepID=A0ABV6DN88_9BACL